MQRLMSKPVRMMLATVIVLLGCAVAYAQNVGSYGLGTKAPPPSPDVLQSLTISQETQDKVLGQTIPLDGTFYDHTGKSVTLHDVIGGKPTILVPIYFRCPMLCNQTIENLLTCLRGMPKLDKTLSAGNAFNLVFFSIDSFEHPLIASGRREAFHKDYDGRATAVEGVWFLSSNPKNTSEQAGQSSETIRAVTDFIGFKYYRINTKKQKEVAPDKTATEIQHSTAILVLTPTGQISSYNTQSNFAPNELADQLTMAARGEKGTSSSFPSLSCFAGADENGLYAWAMRILAWSAAPFVLLIVGIALVARRRARLDTRTPNTL